MMGKPLAFIGIVVLAIAIILCMVGWSVSDGKAVKDKDRTNETPRKEIPQEIKIVAVKEQAAKSPEKPPEKRVAPKTKKKTEAKVSRKSTANTRNSEEKHVRANVSVPESKKKTVRLSPANFKMNRDTIDAGLNLIETKSPVPIVLASYDRIGFDAYLRKMKDMGGLLFVGDALSSRILARVMVMSNDVGSYSFSGLDAGNLDRLLTGMALFRPREISGESLVNDILNYAQQSYSGDLRCVVLLPLDKEAAILGSLKDYVHTGGYNISQFDLVWGSYFQSGREFGLKLEKGRLGKSGEIISLNMALKMSWG